MDLDLKNVSRFLASLKPIGVALGFLGAFALGIWNFQVRQDAKYADAEDMERRFTREDLKIEKMEAAIAQQARMFQKAELRALQKEEFELRAIKDFRKLTITEKSRLDQLQRQIADAKDELSHSR